MDPLTDRSNFKMHVNDFETKYKLHINSLKAYHQVLTERAKIDEYYGLEILKLSNKLDSMSKNTSNKYIGDHFGLMSRVFS
jgi:hypothetical protein